MSSIQVRGIIRKELLDQFARAGYSKRGVPVVGFLIYPVVLGVIAGAAYAQKGDGTFAGVLLAFAPVTTSTHAAVDAIAGERERGTLETLLATPMTARTLIRGKVAAIAALAGITVAALLTTFELAAVFAPGKGGFSFGALMATAVLSFLGAMLGTATGVLLSANAPTVQAAQRLALPIMLGLASVCATPIVASLADEGKAVHLSRVAVGSVALLLLVAAVSSFAEWRTRALGAC